ncbi:MAG: hypothetical protein MR775_01800 [Erysipelotrichaceae bacterium]|nr:hypothetical protein [Erysipelotrichaceae bacterium]
MDSDNVKIEKEDILKNIYFIAEMAQNTSDKGMYGSLAGKSDLMGGIFDRWINVIPESVIFNKVILPKVSNGHKVTVITDFYKYNPKQDTIGIAPDVIGLRIDDKIIPFAVFDEKWKPIDGAPQIEVKTFKKSQQMVSLRDQGYVGKFLVMVESNFRVDYLLPFFDSKYFSESTYQQMIMEDNVFIKSNNNHLISHLKKVDTSDASLGSLTLLKITETSEFEKCATYCPAGISPIRINSIDEKKVKQEIDIKISDMCLKQPSGLFRFKNEWYQNLNNKVILDFYCDHIESVSIIKRNKMDFYITSPIDCIINNFKLIANRKYKVSLMELNREGSKNGEYFMQKELINFIPDMKKELLCALAKEINKEF